ncbi:hypothetical protein SAMN04488517_1071, partial [Jannaschia rubra]
FLVSWTPALFGILLPCLEFDGRQHPVRVFALGVVECLDVLEHVLPRGLWGRAGPWPDPFPLEKLEEAFRDCAVMTISASAHAGFEIVLRQECSPVVAPELPALNWVNQDGVLGLPAADGREHRLSGRAPLSSGVASNARQWFASKPREGTSNWRSSLFSAATAGLPPWPSPATDPGCDPRVARKPCHAVRRTRLALDPVDRHAACGSRRPCRCQARHRGSVKSAGHLP